VASKLELLAAKKMKTTAVIAQTRKPMGVDPETYVHRLVGMELLPPLGEARTRHRRLTNAAEQRHRQGQGQRYQVK